MGAQFADVVSVAGDNKKLEGLVKKIKEKKVETIEKTITTPNRFTTFIQSSQGKLPASLLLIFLIIVIFSCKDDSAFIGLKKDPRLKAEYVDIPLYPSVVNVNSILTENIAGDPFARFLVGKVTDPRFGSLTATTYLNFSPPLTAITIDPTATADSIVMELAVDFINMAQRLLRWKLLKFTNYSTH